MTTTLTEKLNALWRNVDAIGGAVVDNFDRGWNEAVSIALEELEKCGFSEGESDAADMLKAQAAEIERLIRERDEARAALSAVKPNQWQPIESVPDEAKDSDTSLLLFCPGQPDSEFVVGYFWDEYWVATVDWVSLKPTHYMPLPKRPEGE